MSAGNENLNKVEKVVGLKYDTGDGLPKVILKGSGDLAEEIVEKGEQIKGKPFIVKDPDLVDQLYQLPVDSDIRPELFELVAAVLVHVYSVEAKMGGSDGSNRN